jgi:hypothetical protein
MKDNKIIAEFMGVYSKENGYDYIKTGNKGVCYHISWDWLMPVVEKCLTTDEPTDGHHYFINDALLTCNIDVVYDRVLEFIKECI